MLSKDIYETILLAESTDFSVPNGVLPKTLGISQPVWCKNALSAKTHTLLTTVRHTQTLVSS